MQGKITLIKFAKLLRVVLEYLLMRHPATTPPDLHVELVFVIFVLSHPYDIQLLLLIHHHRLFFCIFLVLFFLLARLLNLSQAGVLASRSKRVLRRF